MKMLWRGEKLKQRRKELGLTTEELASKLGTTHNHITIWEMEKAAPNGAYLLILSEVLKKDPKYFYDVSVEAESASDIMEEHFGS